MSIQYLLSLRYVRDRHLALLTSCGLDENFRFRVGYSHQVRKEMSVNNIRSMAGFSLGFGFKVSKFRLDYGLGKQHLAGGMNHLSISTNFSEFKKK